MTIGTRLAASFGIVLALLLAVGGVSILRLDGLNRTFQNTLSHDLLVVAVAFDAESHARAGALKASELFIHPDTKAAAGVQADLRQRAKIVAASLETLARVADTSEAKALEGKVKAGHRGYASSLLRVEEAFGAGDRAAAEKLFVAQTLPALESFNLSLKALSKHYVGSMDEAGADSAAEYRRARGIVVALTVTAVLAGALLAWTITRGLVRRLGGEPDYAVRVARRIADGDLATHVETRSGDTTSLLAAMKHMQQTLSRVMGRIGAASDGLKTIARELATGSAELSGRTEAQAASLEETASSMEELTATVRQNADGAAHANELANANARTAVKGGEAMQQIAATMGSISQGASRVGDITSVIDGIAFQTNILALNAAVEAARAGEHGRGFAVVAAEVRCLAQRSATAAKQIKALVEDSVGRIGTGVKLVEEAGGTLQAMMDAARRVAAINSQITAASREQAAGIEQVTEAVSRMEQGMQQNAALVEQTGASVQSLESQADALASAVAMFRRSSGPPLAVASARRVEPTRHLTQRAAA